LKAELYRVERFKSRGGWNFVQVTVKFPALPWLGYRVVSTEDETPGAFNRLMSEVKRDLEWMLEFQGLEGEESRERLKDLVLGKVKPKVTISLEPTFGEGALSG